MNKGVIQGYLCKYSYPQDEKQAFEYINKLKATKCTKNEIYATWRGDMIAQAQREQLARDRKLRGRR